jgi:hypothetical protein
VSLNTHRTPVSQLCSVYGPFVTASVNENDTGFASEQVGG